MAIVTKVVNVLTESEAYENNALNDYFDYEEGVEDTLAWVSSLVDVEKDKTLRGLLIKTPVADGYAMYVVVDASKDPVELAHYPLGDAWQADPIWLRGLTRRDIVEMELKSRAIEKILGGL